MKSGLFDGHVCTTSNTGFVITVELPLHPEDSRENLYPRPVNGKNFRHWMETLPGVLMVREGYRGEKFVSDIVVRSEACGMSEEEFAAMVKKGLDEAGYQW